MFEFFFKYPRSLYERGEFALLGAWPKWVLVLLILAAAAGLAALIASRLARAAPVIRGWRAWVIWALQTLLAAMVLVLLWQPAITVAELKPHQNIIASHSGSAERRFGQPQPLVPDAPLPRR
jgi:hypothetical protein